MTGMGDGMKSTMYDSMSADLTSDDLRSIACPYCGASTQRGCQPMPMTPRPGGFHRLRYTAKVNDLMRRNVSIEVDRLLREGGR